MTRLLIVSLVVEEDYDISQLKLSFVFQQHSMMICAWEVIANLTQLTLIIGLINGIFVASRKM